MKITVFITFILAYWMSLLPAQATPQSEPVYPYQIQWTDTLSLEESARLDTLYKLKEQGEEIQRHHTMIRRMAITICVMTSAFLSVSLILWIAWRKIHSTRMKKQQAGLSPHHDLPAETALQAPEPPAEIQKSETPEESKKPETPAATTDTDHYLFKRIVRLIQEEKLYLNPDLSRQDLLDQLAINKNHFSQIMQKNLQMTLPEYLNQLRVQHAIALMKQHPHFTTQALAEESGFKNVRNFQRNFKSVTGMTFTEYKESINRGGKFAEYQHIKEIRYKKVLIFCTI